MEDINKDKLKTEGKTRLWFRILQIKHGIYSLITSFTLPLVYIGFVLGFIMEKSDQFQLKSMYCSTVFQYYMWHM